MAIAKRIAKSRSHMNRQSARKTGKSLLIPSRVIRKALGKGNKVFLVVDDVPVKYVAVQQVGMDQHRPALPAWLKIFLRWVYHRYGWAAVEGIQFRGAFDDESDARWAANCQGGSYRAVPHNAALPEETCQFGVYDHPQSEDSNEYRNRKLSFVAVPRLEVERLEKSLRATRIA